MKQDILKQLDEQFSINKHFPNYIYKPIFRAGFVLILLAFIYVAYSSGFDFSPKASVYCNAEFSCINPLYLCNQENYEPPKRYTANRTFQEEVLGVPLDFKVSNYTPFHEFDCEQYKEIPCNEGVCDREYLEPHERIGEEEPKEYKFFKLFVWCVIITCFGLNQVLYLWRKVKW